MLDSGAVQVRSYDVFIDLDFKKLKFKGKVDIEISSEQDIVLNAVDLVVHTALHDQKNLKIRQSEEELIVETGPFDGRLEINYEGLIPDSLAGIYRASYDSAYIVTTHFEAAQARRMLPCVDRPDAKAEFRLSVNIDKDLEAISNMPIESIVNNGAKKTVNFQKTPKMSTYLLYLGVGNFAQQTQSDKPQVILATTPGKAESGKFAQDEAIKAIRFYEEYYGIPYNLPKVHLIAVPEFAMGAMENWGAITFREMALLIDANSSTRARKRVSEVVAHELAHQWFGNLVTMKWWDDLWLNESFATFMAYKVLDNTHPDWKVWEDFLRGETAGAMARDCLKNTHPIEVQVKSPAEIEQIFDAISYGKGASILRMIEAYIGKDAFEEGIRRYLSTHAYGNATGNDLWTTLEQVSGKQVQKIMTKWIKQPGYPIVKAQRSEGHITLQQERFLISDTSERETWPIPITMEINGQRREMLLEKAEEKLEAKDVKSFKINIDRTGFYRVNYVGSEGLVWKSALSAIDRWGIISDAFAFLLSGNMNFTDYAAFLGRFTQEADNLPVHEVSDQLSLLHTILPNETAQLSRIFHRSQLQIHGEDINENTSILRGTLASRLTLVDDNYAKELAPRFKNFQNVKPDMKQAVALAYARSKSDYAGLKKAYRSSNSDEDKVRFLNAMTAFSNESLLNQTLDFTLSGEVKRQDVRTVILAATEKPEAKNATWIWLRTNIEKLRSLYQSTGILSSTFLTVIPILGIGRIHEMEDFLKQSIMPEAETGIKAGLETLRAYNKLVAKVTHSQ